ncbi:MAG: gliding motility-associated C-terminal domain-containing protein, partial [Bacteroidia bacterium]|nr:gliding motility-associated C-terminal domain-containing protein [Bacteroidia bacterium]
RAYRFLDYNGYTTVLLAEYYPLEPCQVYHIKLAIADVGDGGYDSGVFLEAKSFQSTAAALSFVEGTTQRVNRKFIQEGCSNGSFRLQRNVAIGTRQAFKLRLGGTASLGIDYLITPSIRDSIIFNPGERTQTFQIIPLFRSGNQGTRFIVFETTSPLCFFQTLRDTLWIEDTPPLSVRLISSNSPICAGQNITITAIASGGTERPIYQWGRDGAGNPQTFTIYRDTLIKVIVKDACPNIPIASDSIWARIRQPNPNALSIVINKIPQDTTVCQGSRIRFQPHVSGGTGNYTYRWNNGPIQTIPLFEASITQPQEITLQVEDGCTVAVRRIKIQIAPVLRIAPLRDTLVCAGTSLSLRPQIISTSGQIDFRWQTPEGEKRGPILSIVPRTSSTYRLSVTDLCQTQPLIFNFQINVPPPLSLRLIPSDTLLCYGQSFSIQAETSGGMAPLNLRWAQNGNLLGERVSVLHSTAHFRNATFSAQLQDFCGSSLQKNISIQTHPLLSIKTNTSDTTICQGQTITLNATPLSGSGNYNYNWKPGEYSTSEIVISPSTSTTYTLTVSDACSSLSKNIVIQVKPISRLQVSNDTTICTGSSITLKASVWPPLSTSPIIEWRWNNGYYLGNALQVQPTENTIYTAYYYDGCTPSAQTQTVKVNIYSPIILLTSQDTNICPNTAITMWARARGGKSPYSYHWQTTPSSTDSTLTINLSHTTTFTVVARDGCGQRQVKNIKINVFPPLEIQTFPQQDTTICPNTTIELRAFINKGSGNYQFSWEGISNTQPVLQITPVAPVNYTLNVKDGCTTLTRNFSIHLFPIPQFRISPDTTVCLGTSLQLKAELVTLGIPDNFEYRWLLPSGNQHTGPNLLIAPTSEQVYSLQIKGLCIAQDIQRQIRINIFPAPIIRSNLRDTTLCAGQSLTLTAIAVGGGGGPYLYRWEDPNARSIGNRPNWNFTPIMSGRYRIIANDRCNRSSSPFEFEIKMIPRTLKIEGLQDTTICPGQTLVLTPRVSGGSGNYFYYWNNSSQAGNASWSVTPTSSSRYKVRISDGCQDTTVHFQVILSTLPTLRTNNDTSICYGSSTTLFAQALPAASDLQYKWKWGTNQEHIGQFLNISPTEPTEYTVEVTGGCLQTPLQKKVKINLLEPLHIFASTDTVVCKGSLVTLKAYGLGGIPAAYQWEWQNRWGQKVSQNSTLEVVIEQEEQYTVILKDGCTQPSARATIKVTLTPEHLQFQVLPDTIISVCPNKPFTLELRALNAWGTPTFYLNNLPISSTLNYQTPQNTILELETRDRCTRKKQNVYVKVLPLPQIHLVTDTILCKGQQIVLTPQVSFESLELKYDWYFEGNRYPGRSISFIPPTSGPLKLAVSGGCITDTLFRTVQIHFHDPLKLFTSSDTSICPSQKAQLWARASGGNPQGSLLQWYNEAGILLSTGSSLEISPATTSRYWIRALNICETVEKAITIRVGGVNPPLSWHSFSTAPTVCKNQPFTLWAKAHQGTGNYIYTWRLLGNVIAQDPQVRVQIQSTTTFYVSAYDGCTSIDTFITAKIHPPLRIETTNDTTICQGSRITLWAKGIGGDGNYNYYWLRVGSTENAITINPNQSTIYYVSLSDGCNDSTLVKAINVKIAIAPNLTTLPDTTVCKGAQLTMEAWVTGGLPPYTWQWRKNSGEVLSNQRSFELIIDNSLNLEIAVTDRCGVQRSASNRIRVWDSTKRLSLGYLTPDTFICKGQPILLKAAASQAQGNVSYIWSNNNNRHVGKEWLQTPFLATTYYLKIQDACSTIDTSVKVRIYPSPFLTARDTFICFGNTVLLRAQVIGGKTPITITWKGEGIDFSGNSFHFSPETTTRLQITAQDACGFQDQKQIQIFVAPPLRVKILPVDTICPGQSIKLQAIAEGGKGNYTYNWYNQNGYVASGQQLIFTPGGTETFVVEVNDDCNSLSAIDTLTLPYYAPTIPLQITNLPNDTAICPNQLLALNPKAQGGIGNYYWLWQPGNISAQRIVITPPSTDTFTYTVRLQDKCTYVEKIIRVKTISPLSLVLPKDTTLCTQASWSFMPTFIGGKEPIKWNYTATSQQIPANDSLIIVPPYFSGSIQIQATDACAQKSEKNIQITRFSSPFFELPNDTAICKGTEIILRPTFLSSKLAHPLEYQWYKQDSLLARTSSLTYPVDREHVLFLKVRDFCGNIEQDSILLKLHNKTAQPLKLILLPQDSIFCPNQKVNIEIKAEGGSGPYHYFWKPAQDSSWQPFPLAIHLIGYKEQYSFKATDICQTTTIIQKTFYLPSSLEVRNIDTTLCRGESIKLQVQVEGGKPPYACKWETLEEAEPTITIVEEKLYEGSLIDACNNKQKVTAKLRVAQPLELQDTTFRICYNHPQWISLRLKGGAPPLEWYWIKGTDTVSRTAEYRANARENEELVVNVIGRCLDKATAQVKIQTVVPTEFDFRVMPHNFCAGDTVKVELIGTPPSEARAIWDFGGASLIGGTNFGPYVLRVPYQKELTIKLFAQTQDCQYDTIIKTFKIQTPPNAHFYLPPSMCWQNNSFNFMPQEIENNSRYTWQMGPWAIPSVIEGAKAQNVHFSQPGKHTITLVAKNEYCKAQSSQSIEIWEHPLVLADTLKRCAINPEPIIAKPFWNNWQYVWYKNPDTDLCFFKGHQFTPRQILKDTLIWVQAINEKGCTSLVKTPILVKALPLHKVRIASRVTELAFEHQPLRFKAEADTTIKQYLWQFSTQDSAYGEIVFYTFTQNGIYSVILKGIDKNGCPTLADTLKIDVNSYSKVEIPNAFSPNGDGNNEEFYIYHQGLEYFEIQIFDRYGVLLFHSHDPNFRWKGTSSEGEALPEGIYIFILTAKGKDGRVLNRKGTITLLR